MRRRAMILCAMFLGVVVIVAVAMIAANAQPGLARANFDRIEMGMTENDVETLLGCKTHARSSTWPANDDFPVDPIGWSDTYFFEDGARAEVFYIKSVVSAKTWQDSEATLIERLTGMIRRCFKRQ